MALLLSMAANDAMGEVEWFAKERPKESGYRWSSHVGTWAQAVGSLKSESECTFDWVNGPEKLIGWWQNFDGCEKPHNLVQGSVGVFRSEDKGVARGRNSSKQEGSLDVLAAQQVTFEATRMTLAAEIRTKQSGASAANRAIPRAWGEVYFRVSNESGVRLSLKGQLTWSGRATAGNGGLQVYWMPNTLTSSRRDFERVNFSFQQTRASEPFTKEAFLGPGVYAITWRINNDVNDVRVNDIPNGDSLVRLEVKVVFGAREMQDCPDPPISRAPGWSKGANRTAKVVPMDSGKPASKPMCLDSGICWQRRPVNFKIDQEGAPKEENDKVYTGYEYVPGTLRRDVSSPLSCEQLDPHFNCHGLTFAEGRYWLDEDDTKKILERCEKVVPRPGAAKVFETDHSQTMLGTPAGAVDEKLGVLRYGSLLDRATLDTQSWAKHKPQTYRCF